METLVVGFDGTDESKDVIAYAQALAKATKADLVVACITSRSPFSSPARNSKRSGSGSWRDCSRMRHGSSVTHTPRSSRASARQPKG